MIKFLASISYNLKNNPSTRFIALQEYNDEFITDEKIIEAATSNICKLRNIDNLDSVINIEITRKSITDKN